MNSPEKPTSDTLVQRLRRDQRTIRCPECMSENINKTGKRKIKSESIQLYQCKDCGKYFSKRTIRNVSYSTKNILTALSLYNQGYSQSDTVGMLRSRYKVTIPQTTLSNWIGKYSPLLTFLTMRQRYKIDPEEIIFTKKFQHQQVYEFKYHTLKNNIAGKEYPEMRDYIKSVPTGIPDSMFSTLTRCATFKLTDRETSTRTRRVPENNATKMTELAISLAKRKIDRHEKVEDFFLTNDSSTFAVEIPVYMTQKEAKRFNINIKEPLSGHIDILQYRNHTIQILDYKPDDKLGKNHVRQLTLYAYCLTTRTGIPLQNFKCAVFNEKGYVDFSPR